MDHIFNVYLTGLTSEGKPKEIACIIKSLSTKLSRKGSKVEKDPATP